MRARYSAYAKDRLDFLLDTWHPTTRPAQFKSPESMEWTGLVIHSTEKGTPDDSLGYVAFTAGYIKDGQPGELKEASEFIKVSGHWFYLNGKEFS